MANRGNMDISEQRGTYSDFLKFTKWVTIIVVATVVLLALTVA